MCRAVSRLIFGNEYKSNLNALTDALQKIEPEIFLQASLRHTNSQKHIVIDALRFRHDYDYAFKEGYHIIRVSAPQDLRRKWLSERDQEFDFDRDGTHASETQLNDVGVDAILNNDGKKSELYRKIETILQNMSSDLNHNQ